MVLKSGIDLTHVDPSFAPGDDLYRHLNGGWLKSHQIPADRASDGVAYALHDEAEAQVREIIESAHATAGDNGDAQKIGDLYRSFMNTDAIEKLGVSPLSAREPEPEVEPDPEDTDDLASSSRRVVPQTVLARQLANPFLAPDFSAMPAPRPTTNRLASWELLTPLFRAFEYGGDATCMPLPEPTDVVHGIRDLDLLQEDPAALH